MKKHSKLLKICLCMLCLCSLFVAVHNDVVYAYEDGAYIVSRTSTYVNPDTGLTANGDTSNATGTNMATKILAQDVLVEISGGRIYVTIGLGMYSEISNVKIRIQDSAGGAFREVSYTNTGSSTLNGDTCMHYRFEVTNPNLIISPKFTVTGMGRELEFYIVLNMSSMTQGTSIYKSEMVQNTTTSTDTNSSSNTNTTTSGNTSQTTDGTSVSTEEVVSDIGTVSFTEKEEELATLLEEDSDLLLKYSGLSTHFIIRKSDGITTTTTSSATNYIPIAVGLGSVAMVVGAFFMYQRKKQGVIS